MIELRVGGQVLEGWSRVSVSRKADALAGSFSFSFGETQPDDPVARVIQRGQTAGVYLEDEIVLEGVIGELSTRYDGRSASVTAAGRDIAGDLVDSSAIAEPGEWNGARLETIAAQLLSAFSGISYRADLADPAAGTVSTFSLNTGETVFSALDRLARLRGLVLNSDGAGGVYMRRPGSTRAPVAISRAATILEAELRDSDSGRFSKYIAHGQAAGLEGWDAGGSPGQSLRAEAEDPGVGRDRPLVIVAGAGANVAEREARVAFEATSRAGKSRRVSYTLPGWTLEGHRWEPGERVPVYDPALGIGTSTGSPVDLVLVGVRFSASSGQGARASLELMPPGAFTLEPVPEPKTEGPSLWDL